ncbi:MAG: PAS domain S-box protein [Planctomycetales bacterium]|nr:PAS domain S-box protein [bacterium]UNM06960.1 MAG: PAS domain S-box protein [Planctomycetales bacterium]
MTFWLSGRGKDRTPVPEPAGPDLAEIEATQLLLKRASESEQRYRQLAESCPQGISIHIDGRFIYANPGMARLFAYESAEDMIGLRAVEMIVVDQRETASRRNHLLQTTICNMDPQEYDFLRADGSTFRGMIYPTSVEIDGRLAVQGLIIDISESHEQHQRILESEERYRALTENSPLAISIQCDDQFRFVNRRMAEMFGYGSPEEMIGLRPVDHFREDFHQVAGERYRRMQAGETGFPPQVFAFVRADGSSFMGEIHSKPIRYGGEDAIQSMITDVTDRLESKMRLEISEQRFSDYISHSTEAIWRIDMREPVDTSLPREEQMRLTVENAVLAECNLPFALALGFGSTSELVGRPVTELMGGDSVLLDRAGLLIDNNYSVSNYMRVRELGNGQRRYDEQNITSIIRDGRLVSLWGNSRNVTDRMQALSSLETSEERFRQYIDSTADNIWCLSFEPPVPTDLPIEEQVEHMLHSGYITEGNRHSAAFFGRDDIGEVLNRRLLEIYPVEFIGQARMLLRAFITSGYRTDDVEEHSVDADGNQLTLISSTRGIMQDGRLRMIWGTSRDVTEKLHMQRDLAASEKRYRELTEQSSEGIWRIEFDSPIPTDLPLDEQVRLIYASGRIADCNDLMATYYGCETAADVRGRLLEDLHEAGGLEIGGGYARTFVEGGYLYRNLDIRLARKNGRRRIHRENANGQIVDGCLVSVKGTTRDVTEEFLTQEKLQASETRYRGMTELSSEAIWRISYDPPVPVDLSLEEQVRLIRENGVLVDCNDHMAEMYGLRLASEVKGRKVRELMSECGLSMALDRAQRFIGNGYRFSEERMTLSYPDGSSRTYLDNAIGVIEDGRLVEARGTSRDVTELLSMQSELELSEQRFRRLVDKAQEGIWCIEYSPPIPRGLNPDEMIRLFAERGVLVECNDQMATLYGVESIEQIHGKRVSEINKVSRLVRNPLRIRVLIDNDFRMRDELLQIDYEDGSSRMYLYNTDGEFVDGELVRIWGTCRDLTDSLDLREQLRQQELRYELAMDGAQLGTWDIDLLTEEVKVDDKLLEQLGFSRGELELTVEKLVTLIHPMDVDRVNQLFDRHVHGETPRYESEYRIRHRNGSWIWVQSRGRVTERDADGRPLRAIGTHMDVTERKLAEQRLAANEARFRELAERSTEAIWRIDFEEPVPVSLPREEQVALMHRHGILRQCNDLMAEFFGLEEASSIIGGNVTEIIRNDRLASTTFDAGELIDKGFVLLDEVVTNIYSDGSVREYMMNSEGKVVDGRLHSIWGTCRDMTRLIQLQRELEVSEARFRELVERSTEAIWRIEYDPPIPTSLPLPEQVRLMATSSRMAECNDLMARVYDLERAEQIKGQSLLDIANASRIQHVNDMMTSFIRNGYRSEDDLMLVRYVDGSERKYIYKATGLVEDGQLIATWGTSRDVTDNLSVMQRLEESEQRYELALDASGLGTWDLDVLSGRVTFNERFAQILGHAASGLTWNFDTWISTIHPTDRRYVQDRIQSVINGDSDQFEVEQRLRHKEGHWIWTLSRGKVIERGADGRALRALGTEMDITERRHAEELLRESEQRYREFVVNSSQILWCMAFETAVPIDLPVEEQLQRILQDGYLEDCNDLFAQSWGFSRAEELIGRSNLEINSGISGDNTIELMRRFVQSGYSLSEAVDRVSGVDGSERYFMSNISGTVHNGALMRIWGATSEMTDLMQARESLQQSELRYREFVANSSEAIWRYECEPPIPVDLPPAEQARLLHERLVIAECNDVFAGIYGYPDSDSVVGVALSTMLEPSPGLLGMFERFVASGYRMVDDEDRITPERERERFFLNSAQGVVEDGRLVMLWGTTRDVTEQRRAAMALADSETRLSSMMQMSPVGIFHLHPDGNVRYMNPRAEELFGMTAEQCMDQGFLNAVHAEDRERTAQASMEMIFNQAGLEMELRLVSRGRTAWVFTQISPVLDNSGELTGYVGMLTDITDRKLMENSLAASEKRNRQLINTMAEGMILVDDENQMVFVNSNGCRILGRDEAELLGHRLWDFAYDKENAELLQRQRELRRKGMSTSYELDIARPDGSRRRLSITAGPQFDEQGAYIGALGTFQDITETKQMELQLQQAQKMEAVGVLAGGIAHDFNNILQAMLGFADLASDQLEDGSEALACVSEIRAAGQRAAELVRQMLTFSRQSEQTREPVDLPAIVHESVGLLRGSLPSTINIVTDLRETRHVLGNETQIQQVLMNLSTNAFHAMRERGGELHISCSNQPCSEAIAAELGLPAGNPMVSLVVRDTGHGMDQQTAARVFDPYFTTKRVGEGTGLGLATVHGIIRSMGGWISLDSAPGQGTAIQILLPAVEALEQGPVAGEPKRENLRGSETVMVVDDEPGIVHMLNAGLSRLGYRTMVFTDSREAWQHWQQHGSEIDIVVTDQTMPHITGDELSRRILAERPGLPILLCTGYSELIDEESAGELGIAHFVNKPIVPSKLAELIRSTIESRT